MEETEWNLGLWGNKATGVLNYRRDFLEKFTILKELKNLSRLSHLASGLSPRPWHRGYLL